jgi:uncharacterized delta-60 repeat protein
MHTFRLIIALLLGASSLAQAQFTQNLAKVYNGTGDFNDRFTCITKDANGNIIVAGSSVTTGQSRNVLVQKYDAAGAVVWTATFDGADSGADEAAAVVTDAQNNVFVTGYQKGVGVGNDILTLKINAAGTVLWSAVYNSLYNEADQGVSIALDATGAVIVAANSDRDSTTTSNDDIVTLKYDATNGAQVWEKRYNGTGNAADRPVRVRCDANNNVFVAGRTFNGNNDDYITLKYDAAGVQLWAKTEDRTGNDRPTDMVLDTNGDIYVTGRSKVSNYDFYTVKYNNATGTRNWAKTYNSLDDDRATCMAIDAANNIYVGGQVDVNANTATNIYDFGVVKYSSAGVQAWATVTPFTTDDVPSGISVSNNTVAMSGYSANTNLIKDILSVQLNATSGVLNWSKFYNGAALKNDDGNALTTDATDNIYVAGSTEGANGQKDALLIKYTTSGAVAYEKIHVGTGDNSDNARAMTTDAAGNVYMAGYRTTTTDRDFAVWKINTVGDTVWTRTFNGTSSYSSDEAVSIALDATNNVYVTGSAKSAGVGYDIVTNKLDNNGTLVWSKALDNGGLKQNDKADAMAIDATGNVYIVGRTDVNTSSFTNEDALLISYTPAGVQRFLKTYNGTSNGNDRFSHIQLAAGGNIYVSGRTFAGANNDDILIQKYNSAGAVQWTQTHHHNAADIVTATVLDAAENLYIAAYSGVVLGSNAIVFKYNNAGVEQWAVPFGNLNIFDARINALALDATSNLYAAGFTNLANAAAVNTDALLVKFSTAGATTYMFNPLTPSTDGDELTCVAIDAANNVLTAGTEGLSTNKNLVVNMHDTNGAYLAQTTFDGTAANDDIPNIMRIANGQLYVAGSSQSLNAGRDALLLRYTYIRPVATENIALDATINVFPNPFTDIINFDIKTADNATENYTIQIFDALGRKVAEKTAKSNEITSISLEGLVKGVYTYKASPDPSKGGEPRGISGRLIKM